MRTLATMSKAIPAGAGRRVGRVRAGMIGPIATCCTP